jgi:hypothetical protein
MRYRIVRDAYSGFEAQYRAEWWPFWAAIPTIGHLSNSFAIIEGAKDLIAKHKASRGNNVVWTDSLAA